MGEKTDLKGGLMLAPVPVVLVACSHEELGMNVLTIAWCGVDCSKPPIIHVSIRPDRFSYRMIKESGSFTVNLPTVDMLWGRTGDVVTTPEGNEINASNLTDVFKDTPRIRRCQFVQNRVGHLLARLEVSPGFGDEDEERFRAEIHSRTGERMALDIEIVDEIPLTVSGKFRFVINNVKDSTNRLAP